MQCNSRAADAPLFTRMDIRRLLIPLLIEQFLAVSMGMADTMMVSAVGEAAISGVSLVDSVNTLILQILAALATGGAVVASQYLGRGDLKNARKGSAQLYTCLVASTGAAGLLVMLLCRPILSFVFGEIDAQVMDYAATYFIVSAASFPFMGAYSAGAALFRAQGNSRISMFASLVMNVINVGLNALLIFVFHMGVLGAALATLFGRVFAAIYITKQLQRAGNPMRIGSVHEFVPDGAYLRRILRIGVPAGFENGIFHIGKLLVSSLVSTLGTAAIAANAVVNAVAGMANIPGNAVSLALLPVIGQCLGAGRRKEARQNAGYLMLLAYLGIIATNIVVLLCVEQVAGWFSLSGEAKDMAIFVLRTYSVVSMALWPASFTLPGALRAGGDAKFPMMVSIASMWTFRILLCYLFVLKFNLGLAGIWYGMYVDWACRSLLFTLRYRSGKWMDNKVI